jgi:hypothetical protein
MTLDLLEKLGPSWRSYRPKQAGDLAKTGTEQQEWAKG